MRDAVVETPRLRLREIEANDIDFIAEMMSNDEVMRFYPKALDRAGAIEWIERQRSRYARDGHGLWLIEERENGVPVGQAGLVLQQLPAWRKRPYAEVGYLLHRPYWKRGYATEAASAVRDLGFERWKYEEVISLIRPENLPSHAVAGRLGMTIRGTTVFATFTTFVYLRGRAASGYAVL
jgi:RimJ/RimL family protein N-acetyltransferase